MTRLQSIARPNITSQSTLEDRQRSRLASFAILLCLVFTLSACADKNEVPQDDTGKPSESSEAGGEVDESQGSASGSDTVPSDPDTEAPASDNISENAESEQSMKGEGELALVDRAAELGIDFIQTSGASGKRYFPEASSSGVAAFDYDLDGDMDIYLSQAHDLDIDIDQDASGTSSTDGPGQDRLYRNMLVESGELSFEDATAAMGIPPGGYGTGVAVGDYDLDGDPDLLVAQYGADRLLRNDGVSGFKDVTSEAAPALLDERWSSSASFFDKDQDGDLDLFIARYVNYTPELHRPCFALNGIEDYCGPSSYRPAVDQLLENRGDGTFEDITGPAGIAQAIAAGLGVVAADLNGDDLLDLFVANDGMENHLWINKGDGTFKDQALLAGVAYNSIGEWEAGMGVALEDFDGDADWDLYLTHLSDETNTYYHNKGNGIFEDDTQGRGLASTSLAWTGFGVVTPDVNKDGLLDIAVFNGGIIAQIPSDDSEEMSSSNEGASAFEAYHQPDYLLIHSESGRFTPAESLPSFSEPRTSRAAALADLDNDGDSDIIVVDLDDRPRVLLDEGAAAADSDDEGAWAGLQLLQAASTSETTAPRIEAIGATVTIELGSKKFIRRFHRDGSFQAASDPRIIIPASVLEQAELAGSTSLLIRWPKGEQEEIALSKLSPMRYNQLLQGQGVQTLGSNQSPF